MGLLFSVLKKFLFGELKNGVRKEFAGTGSGVFIVAQASL